MVDMKRDARIRAEIKELNDAVSVAYECYVRASRAEKEDKSPEAREALVIADLLFESVCHDRDTLSDMFREEQALIPGTLEYVCAYGEAVEQDIAMRNGNSDFCYKH